MRILTKNRKMLCSQKSVQNFCAHCDTNRVPVRSAGLSYPITEIITSAVGFAMFSRFGKILINRRRRSASTVDRLHIIHLPAKSPFIFLKKVLIESGWREERNIEQILSKCHRQLAHFISSCIRR